MDLHVWQHWGVRQFLPWYLVRHLHLLLLSGNWPLAFPCCSWWQWSLITTSPSHVHSPLRDTQNSCGLISGLQETQNYQTASLLDLPGWHLCFAAAPKHPCGLLHTWASPRMQGPGHFSLGSLQTSPGFPSSSPRDWSLLTKDCGARLPECKHWLCHLLTEWHAAHHSAPLCLSFSHLQNGIYFIRLLRENEFKYVIHLE